MTERHKKGSCHKGSCHKGSCLCGHVAFEAAGEPIHIVNCHCRMCQKAAGAAYLTLAEFPVGDVTWSGAEPAWHESSDKAERGFCPECGSAVAFHFKGAPTIDMAVALFDDPNALAPRDDLWTDSRNAWTPVDAHLNQFKKSRTS